VLEWPNTATFYHSRLWRYFYFPCVLVDSLGLHGPPCEVELSTIQCRGILKGFVMFKNYEVSSFSYISSVAGAGKAERKNTICFPGISKILRERFGLESESY